MTVRQREILAAAATTASACFGAPVVSTIPQSWKGSVNVSVYMTLREGSALILNRRFHAEAAVILYSRILRAGAGSGASSGESAAAWASSTAMTDSRFDILT